jgi:hypothetical protein
MWKELDYSIKSVRRFAPHITDIFTVGSSHPLAINIPFDETQHPAVNIWEKIFLACHDERVTDNFLCLSDDHYLLQPAPIEYPNYYAYNISEYPLRATGIKNFEHPYYRLVRRTRELLGDCLFYNIHAPFVVNKQRFIDVFNKYESEIYTDVGILVKTTYLHGSQNNAQLADYKTKQNEPFESIKAHCKARPVFSTNDDISEGAKDYLIELFQK